MFSRSQLYQMCVGRVCVHLTEQSSGGGWGRRDGRLPCAFQQKRADSFRGRIEQVRGELVTPEVAKNSFVFIPRTSANTEKREIIIHGT